MTRVQMIQVRSSSIVRTRSGALRAVLVALTLLCAGASVLVARPAFAAAAETYTFAFRDADIAQVAEEILGNALGLNYTVDPSVSGKMSFRIERRMTRAQLLESFEAALASNDVVLVRQGESLRLTPRASAKAAGGVRRPEAVGRAGYDVVAVPLTYATPSEVAKVLQSVGPAGVVLQADDKTGILLLGGTGSEIEGALATIQVFDRSNLEGSKMRWFELKEASAPAVAAEIGQLLQASGVTGSTVVPLKRLNGLVAFARNAGSLDEIGRWVEQLDKATGNEASTLWVYRPRNVSADSLGATLISVLAAGPATPGQPTVATTAASGAAAAPVAQGALSLGDEGVRIGIDKESNTLLISASPAQRVQIQKVLEEIDILPTQVLIEASILEVTLTNDFRMGVNWSALAEGGKLKVISTSDDGGAVAPTLPGFAVTFLDSDIKAAVDALGSKTTVELVSAPRIVVVNNRTANLQIGDQVPVVVQSAQSDSTPNAPRVVNVDYRDTGVILNVTPHVSGANTIMLTVVQEVSSVARTVTSGIDSPTIQQRRMESTLIIRDEGTVALGGLISSTRSRGDSGVPYVKDIPVLGSLFKGQDRTGRKTELIVLISVKIMRDDDSMTRVMADLLEDMKEIAARGLLPAN